MNKIKVLIVDDEVDFLCLMEKRLESWGYEVIKASGGKEGLAAVKEKCPDIVLLDYSMPDMDGVLVLKEIRKFNQSLAVIMLTAHADVKNIKDAQELGVSTFIPKLSSYTDVQASLRSALDMAQKKIRENKG